MTYSILSSLFVPLSAFSFSLKNDLIMDVFSEVLIVNIPVGDNIQPTPKTKWLRSDWLMGTVQKIHPLKKG